MTRQRKLLKVSWQLQERRKLSFLNINDPYFSDEDCLVWNGWIRAQFQTMLACLENTTDSSQRDKSTALLIFWLKLKTGLFFQQIASLLNKNNDAGIKMVSGVFSTVAADLDKHFAPSFLGCGHISREKSTEHIAAYSSVLYGWKLCIIWNSTYYYIEKVVLIVLTGTPIRVRNNAL